MSVHCPNCDSAIAWEPGQTSTACPTCGHAIGFSTSQMFESSESMSGFETQGLDGAAALATATPTQIDRYRVVRYLGHGGFGTVYLSYDEQLQRDVAIKVPRPGRFGSESAFLSFMEEARVAASLKHAAIVTIYDIGCDEDVGCFIAMEYIEGTTLAQLLAEGPLSHERVARIVAKIAHAVHYAHQQGVVHRDIKPSNVIIDANDQPHILDFGLGLPDDEQWERDGEIVGTLAYMPPEQLRGETPSMDGRTDIWSLGVILYQTLTGRLPFKGKGDRIREAAERHEPKALRQIDDSIPLELEAITQKCLAKSPRERYSTGRDLANALEEWSARKIVHPINRLFRTASICCGAGLLLWAIYTVASSPRENSPDEITPRISDVRSGGNENGNGDVTAEIRANELNDMLRSEPKLLMFPYTQASAMKHYDPRKRTFAVASKASSIFVTGQAKSRDFELRMGIAANKGARRTGMIFGIQRREVAGKGEVIHGQAIVLTKSRSRTKSVHEFPLKTADGETERAFEVKWTEKDVYHIYLFALRLEQLSNGNFVMAWNSSLAAEQVDPPADECMLIVNVVNDRLKQVRWDNRDLKKLYEEPVTAEDLDLEPGSHVTSQGEFGIWTCFSSAVFRNHYYMPQE